MNESQLVQKASEDISKILSQLEKDSGLVVDTIELLTFDVSTVGARPRYIKTVKIGTRLSAGVEWA